MYVVIWEYEVRPEAQARFEAMYGPQGEWDALFRRYPGYIATELLRGEDPHYYLSVDRWDSAQAYETFQRQAQADYARIDAIGDALTVAERRIGGYSDAG